MTYTGYCVKERKKGVEFEGQVVTTKNGRKMAKGKCPNCGAGMNSFLKG